MTVEEVRVMVVNDMGIYNVEAAYAISKFVTELEAAGFQIVPLDKQPAGLLD